MLVITRVWLVALLYSLSCATHAGALYFYEMSNASESSYGGVGMTARANDSGTVFTNPAGMTRFSDSAMAPGVSGLKTKTASGFMW